MEENNVNQKDRDFKDNTKKDIEESPPILNSWSRLYLLVLVNLIFWLFTFYIIRRIFE